MEFTTEEITRFKTKFVEAEASQCWEWTAGKFADSGYGMFSGIRREGLRKTLLAHRASWMIYNKSSIPKGLFICHHCDNRSCVNPHHLYLGTCTDNNRDTIRRNRGNRAKGSKCSWAKINESQALEILRSDYGPGVNGELAKKFGISQSQVSHIRSGRRWPHLAKFL